MSESSLQPAGEKIQARDCFACGRDNKRGLNIPFFYQDEKIAARYVPGASVCGFDDLVHGGILSALADEAMMHLVWRSGLRAVTAELTMRFHARAQVGKPIVVKAKFVSRSAKLIRAESVLLDDQGNKIATGKGKFLPIADDRAAMFRKRF